ncbi:MAG: C10 family peptidase, partial [Muribaculaceae bacterium]|nr:C10 family peptidase [Muribaculaceae bacterium]
MNRRFRWIVVPALVMGSSIYSFSAKISLSEAQALATEFVRSRTGDQSGSLTLKPVFMAGTENEPLYYVFNIGDNTGFVMVSGDDTTTPVLGYSFKNGYPVNNMPDAMKWMLAGLEREIKAAPSIQRPQVASDLRKSARQAAERAAEGEKLLETPTWSQEAPFNKMIPGQPLVGCVGTAMSTIMKFYEWPVAGIGSFKDVDFATTYDWTNMRMDNYRSGYSQEEGDAVALLMFHASKSIDTQYSMSGSSAYESRVPAALSTYFGYDPGVSIKKRSEVATQAEWDKIVKDEIDAGRPVLYCGQDVTAGHAFVCDGYRGGYFHFNWGWGGGADGYFLTTALNPVVSRTHSYNNLNTIVYNIKPADGKVAAWSPIHITNEQQQPGIGSDLTDLTNGQAFKVRVGYLKNRTYDDFKGKIAVALCDAAGKMKALLSNERDFSMYGMESTIESPARIVTFDGCKLPSGVSVDDSDRIYIVTKGANDDAWLPVAGELLTANTLDPKAGTPATFRISLPSTAGVKIEGSESVVKGFDYSFKVTLDNPAEDVVTVKANGIILTASDNNTYNL